MSVDYEVTLGQFEWAEVQFFRQTARLRTGPDRLSGNMDRWPKPISLATTVMSWQARDLWKSVGRSRPEAGRGLHSADYPQCQLANLGMQRHNAQSFVPCFSE